mgnify:FL=1
MFQKTTAIKKLQRLYKRVRVVQGGTSASKTFGILSILIDYSIKNPNTETSVVAESIPHLRRGAVRDFKKIMLLTKRWRAERFNRSLLTYTFGNGSTIEFFSADNEAKLRGARRDVLYINEANNIAGGFSSYLSLAVRTLNHVWIDFNPSAEFWANTELENDPEVDWLVLTYKDNEAAPQAAVDEILKAKQKADKGNLFWENWYRVYGLGLVGSLQGAIYTNWTTGAFKEITKAVYGQDFGFSDPTTLVKTSIDHENKNIYIQECFYKKGLTPTQILTLNQKFAGDSLIVADSADPRLIDTLSSQGCNIVASIKGLGSVVYGIGLLQDYDLIIDPESLELIKEIKNYIWLEKKSQTPDHKYSHLMDALRYAVAYQLANPHRGKYYIY